MENINNTSENQAIQLLQPPKIAHKLQEVGAKVTARIKELNIDALVANEDTVKFLKETRAALRKESQEYEESRKWLKNAIMKPYDDFDALYKVEISGKYADADNIFKTKIDSVENKIKDNKREALKSYFINRCGKEKILFVDFTQVGLDINLSTSQKKYEETIDEFLKKIKNDLALIESEEHQEEILVEYKKTLNSVQAIMTVRKRKEAIEAEKKIKAQAKEGVKKEPSVVAPEKTISEFSGSGAIPPNPIQDLKLKVTIEIEGTMEQMNAIGVYMKENNITYKFI